MNVPARSAAAMSISPLCPSTWRPSRVKVTVSTGWASVSSLWSVASFSRLVLPAVGAG